MAGGEIVGSPVHLGDSVNDLEQATEGRPMFATARDGTLVYMAGEATTSLIWLTRSGASTTVLSDSGLRNPRLSPDGGRALVNGMSRHRGTPTRVLERPGPQWVSSWSPDGQYLMLDDGPGFSRDQVVTR